MQLGSVPKKICMGQGPVRAGSHAIGKYLEENMHGNQAFGGKTHASEKRQEENMHGERGFWSQTPCNWELPGRKYAWGTRLLEQIPMQMGSDRKKICMGNAAFGAKPHANVKLPEGSVREKEASGGLSCLNSELRK